MTTRIYLFQSFVSVPENRLQGKRKQMLSQIAKINLILLTILLLNGISNSYQQNVVAKTKKKNETSTAITKLKKVSPLVSNIFN